MQCIVQPSVSCWFHITTTAQMHSDWQPGICTMVELRITDPLRKWGIRTESHWYLKPRIQILIRAHTDRRFRFCEEGFSHSGFQLLGRSNLSVMNWEEEGVWKDITAETRVKLSGLPVSLSGWATCQQEPHGWAAPPRLLCQFNYKLVGLKFSNWQALPPKGEGGGWGGRQELGC